MSRANLRRPGSDEFAPYYGRYIERVPDGDILPLLERQIDDVRGTLGRVPESQENVPHPPYTWTLRQVVGHLIDVEKVFGYRAHRFACNDLRPIPGMEQDDFVANLDYQCVTLASLTNEWEQVRLANIPFLRRIPPQAWDRIGTIDGNILSVRAIAYILVGHVTYHLDIVRKRVS